MLSVPECCVGFWIGTPMLPPKVQPDSCMPISYPPAEDRDSVIPVAGSEMVAPRDWSSSAKALSNALFIQIPVRAPCNPYYGRLERDYRGAKRTIPHLTREDGWRSTGLGRQPSSIAARQSCNLLVALNARCNLEVAHGYRSYREKNCVARNAETSLARTRRLYGI